MATVTMRCVLFFCSYAPLTAIVCVLYYDQWPWWVTALVGGVFGVGSILLTLVYLAVMRHMKASNQKKVLSFSRHDSDVMSYVASYLVPFVSFSLTAPKQIAALLIFVLVLLVIYVNSNMIYINPVLSLLGYSLYEIEIENSQRSHYYIARKRLERNREIRFISLSDDIFLESKR